MNWGHFLTIVGQIVIAFILTFAAAVFIYAALIVSGDRKRKGK